MEKTSDKVKSVFSGWKCIKLTLRRRSKHKDRCSGPRYCTPKYIEKNKNYINDKFYYH